MKNRYLFTSESVTEGHPDKVCDQISDAVLDEIFKEDPSGRVACETMVTTGLAFVAGEITTSCYVDIPKVVRNTIRDIGYTHANYGFDYLTCGVITSIQEQSPDISMGVDVGGAGDQGMMFGYATDETRELMPMPIVLAHALTRRLATVRKEKLVNYLRPDGKSQVTVDYVDGKPERVEAVVISVHHDRNAKMEDIKKDMKKLVIEEMVPKDLMDKDTKIYINPTGRFEVGGPQGDTGVTGRKIIVDTYGGVGSHGGGCFSGKDPTKVDRSASYMARYVAKNIVAAGIAQKCEIQFAYAIGVAEPVSVMVNTFGTGKVTENDIVKLVRENFDLTPGGIVKKLKLRRPIYRQTAAYGHFGRSEEGFTWEEIDMADILKKRIK
ncbi:MAG: methionine adenosyltransferase [Deltaproteobacteria bacterium]|nr:methionine adenosyltransferase [Deltaproteobacteria bacterium]